MEDFPAKFNLWSDSCYLLFTMFLLAAASKIHTNNNHLSIPGMPNENGVRRCDIMARYSQNLHFVVVCLFFGYTWKLCDVYKIRQESHEEATPLHENINFYAYLRHLVEEVDISQTPRHF